MERERKFLILKPPPGLARHPHNQIRQGYLAIPGPRDPRRVEVRVRDQAGQHTLTVKGGQGRSRAEIELPIPAKSFRQLWPLTQGRRVEKVRYRIPLRGGLTIELDVYRGKLRGLMTAEVEFDSERQLRAFNPPDWFGPEVTGRPEFANNRLATSKKPPRRPKT
jgi:CYTH domain-containing protein